jgi:site-specific recombinase XerC
VTVPYWVDATLRSEYFQGRSLASEAEAKAIARATVRSGATLSSASMRALSGRDMLHLLPSRPLVSDEHAARLIANLQKEIDRASMLRAPVLRRDKVMFEVARLQGLTAPELLGLTVKDLDRRHADLVFLHHRPGNAAKTLKLLRTYLKQVRPLFIGADGSALFLTLEGKPLARTALGMRFQRALLAAELRHEIWNWTEWVRGQCGRTSTRDNARGI